MPKPESRASCKASELRQLRVLRLLRLLLPCVALLSATGCIPFAVGSTAQTVPVGDRTSSLVASIVVNGGAPYRDSLAWWSRSFNYPMSDAEFRFGLTDASDLGLRIPNGSGLIVNHKQRQRGAAHPDSSAFATMIGGGIVNLGEHLFVEGTLFWNGARRGQVMTYGGLRAMHVLPITRDALSDSPTLGGFLGLRLGSGAGSVSPEIALYYDRSVLALRRRDLVIVPSVTVTDFAFFRGWPRIPRRYPR